MRKNKSEPRQSVDSYARVTHFFLVRTVFLTFSRVLHEDNLGDVQILRQE